MYHGVLFNGHDPSAVVERLREEEERGSPIRNCATRVAAAVLEVIEESDEDDASMRRLASVISLLASAEEQGDAPDEVYDEDPTLATLLRGTHVALGALAAKMNAQA